MPIQSVRPLVKLFYTLNLKSLIGPIRSRGLLRFMEYKKVKQTVTLRERELYSSG